MTNELNYDSIELIETTQASFDYSELENLMGERSRDALRLDFARKLKVELGGRAKERTACGRIVSKNRIHCYKSSLETQQRSEVLQQAWNSGAVD